MTESASSPWMILKFGGTSVASAACWRHIFTRAQQRRQDGYRPLIVCSAPAGVSNGLQQLIDLAVNTAADDDDRKTVLADIHSRYLKLINELKINPDILDALWKQLTRRIEGITLLGEATPRVMAQVMATGELLLTKIGAAYLAQQGLQVAEIDARDCLVALSSHKSSGLMPAEAAYLGARCDVASDPTLDQRLRAMQADVYLTQGFIARNHQDETVLLGRGGSDTSAAYFSVLLAAERCEICTDVPGIYTANPREIPQARLLKQLDYDEAQEIAAMGAKVIHPNCIGPLRRARIPLQVCSTAMPDHPGTRVSLHSDRVGVKIKSILTKSSVWLVSIETVYMWQQVGFLARVFDCFSRCGLSVDLLSTSESTVTVSLDDQQPSCHQEALDQLLEELNAFGRAKLIGPCAAISLVGKNIRAILHQLGGVFEVFKAQQVYLLSQAANDLNLTFVVDQDQVGRLARELHHLLIEQDPHSAYLSLSWAEEFGQAAAATQPKPWWVMRREALLSIAAQEQKPLYVYDAATLKGAVSALRTCTAVDRIFYAMKANNTPEVLTLFYEAGLGFECVSLEEIRHVRRLFNSLDRERILFTPNFAHQHEYEAAVEAGAWITVDNLYPLQQWPHVFRNARLILRIDPGFGAGHHQHVCTGGDGSKFGIPLIQLDAVLDAVHRHGLTVVGLHAHAGSGILQPQLWHEVYQCLIERLPEFPNVKYINVGGGLGVVERPGQQPLDLSAVNASLQAIKATCPTVELWLEPGRYLVAGAGVLLARVTQVKEKGDIRFVGIETGMNSLIRPSLYGSYHEIVNLTRLDAPKSQIAHVVGPICETGDTLGYSRLLPDCEEGDIMLIANTGAYGAVMSSHYNMRQPASAYFLHHNEG